MGGAGWRQVLWGDVPGRQRGLSEIEIGWFCREMRALRWAHALGRARPCKTRGRPEHGVQGTGTGRRLQLGLSADVTLSQTPRPRPPGEPPLPPETAAFFGAGLGLGLDSWCHSVSSHLRLCMRLVPSHRIRVGPERGPQAAAASGPAGGQRGRSPHHATAVPGQPRVAERAGAAGLTPQTSLAGWDRSDAAKPCPGASPGGSASRSELGDLCPSFPLTL